MPHGEGRAAPTLTFEWAAQGSYLRMVGTQPDDAGGLVTEHETLFFWDPLANRYEFHGVYPSSGMRMLENGHVEPMANGGIRLHMAVHYQEGEVLPFSDGAIAGPGGHTLEFRRTLSPGPDGGLLGTFFLKRGGRWENPHPQLGLDAYPWSRVDSAGGGFDS